MMCGWCITGDHLACPVSFYSPESSVRPFWTCPCMCNRALDGKPRPRRFRPKVHPSEGALPEPTSATIGLRGSARASRDQEV